MLFPDVGLPMSHAEVVYCQNKERAVSVAFFCRKQRAIAESSLAELEVAYNRLEDEEREKRANGILKVVGPLLPRFKVLRSFLHFARYYR